LTILSTPWISDVFEINKNEKIMVSKTPLMIHIIAYFLYFLFNKLSKPSGHVKSPYGIREHTNKNRKQC
jgi:hypothetical protein